jgi:glycosyltransferase involved in cell wall biosynthesis
VTTREQAEPWIAAGPFMSEQFVEVVESSSPFGGIPRHEARAVTRMDGDPVYLSAGRLDGIKDPLTMLRGFERIAAEQPNARLYLYYLTSEMLDDITSFISDRHGLAGRIELRGRAPLKQMEAVYSSADFILQASTREWSGLAVIEAMSCGCIPIVSDIPSFRRITGGGRFGRLFPVGHPEALASAALSVSPSERTGMSTIVRDHFDRELSFPALARQIDTVYQQLRHERSSAGATERVQLRP